MNLGFFSQKKQPEFSSTRADELLGDKIFPETARAYWNVSAPVAEFYCEKLVRDGVWEKWVGYINPRSGQWLFELRHGDQPPEGPYHDEDGDAWGEDKVDFEIEDLKQMVFYRMQKKDKK